MKAKAQPLKAKVKAAAMIPFVGMAATGAKLVAKVVDNAPTILKGLSVAGDAIKGLGGLVAGGVKKGIDLAGDLGSAVAKGVQNGIETIKSVLKGERKKVPPVEGAGGAKETELFLPDEYYKKQLPSQVSPGTKYLPKYDEAGNVKQIKKYDDYGRESSWVDYTDHGYSDSTKETYHTAPHWHERVYDSANVTGKKVNHRTDQNTPY